MIEARKAVIEDIGSCTALLVDEIQKLDIDITPLEATVMALGYMLTPTVLHCRKPLQGCLRPCFSFIQES